MIGRLAFSLLLFAALGTAGHDHGGSALAATSVSLEAGTTLPPLSGTALSGKQVNLPGDAAGRPLALIIGPEKQSGASAAMWSHAFYNAYGSKVAVYGVALIDNVPGLLRGTPVADVRKSAPTSQRQHESNVLISTDKRYRPLLPPGDPHNAVVILADARGKVLTVDRRPYSPSGFASVRAKLRP